MIVALVGAVLMSVAFVLFIVNLLWTLGPANTLSLILPERWFKGRLPQSRPLTNPQT